MAKFGHLQEFNAELEPITAYLERVELYFSANSIGEDKRLAILLSVIGPKTYGVLRTSGAREATGAWLRRCGESVNSPF